MQGNTRNTMIMKPKLRGESLESGCASVPGTHIDPLRKPECKGNQSKTMIMEPKLRGEGLESGFAYVLGNQISPPWMARMHGRKQREKQIFWSPSYGGKLGNQAVPT